MCEADGRPDRMSLVAWCPVHFLLPTDQFRQAGAGASGVSIGRSYKGNPIPAAAVNLKNAGTTVSRNYIAGTVDRHGLVTCGQHSHLNCGSCNTHLCRQLCTSGIARLHVFT